MSDTHTHPLVDQSRIDAHEQKMHRAASRHIQAGADLAAAKAAHVAAGTASRRAVEGFGDLSALDAEHALNAAGTALAVAEKVHAAAFAAMTKANADRNPVRGAAWAPVMMQGIKDTVAACAKADRARAMLAEADADHLAAAALMQRAVQNGTPPFAHVNNGPRVIRTEAEELAMWRAQGVNTGTWQHPWEPGL
jgi:hypothetical protein